MRKPRSDSKLLNLPEEQRDQLLDMLLSGQPYHAVQKVLQGDPFKVSVSLSSLCSFYGSEAPKRLTERRLGALRVAHEIAEEARKHPGQFDTATIEALTQKAFELAISPTSPAKDVKSLFMLVLKSRDQSLKERQIVLLEEKAKQADEANKIAGDTKLSPSEQLQRLKNVFGAR